MPTSQEAKAIFKLRELLDKLSVLREGVKDARSDLKAAQRRVSVKQAALGVAQTEVDDKLAALKAL